LECDKKVFRLGWAHGEVEAAMKINEKCCELKIELKNPSVGLPFPRVNDADDGEEQDLTAFTPSSSESSQKVENEEKDEGSFKTPPRKKSSQNLDTALTVKKKNPENDQMNSAFTTLLVLRERFRKLRQSLLEIEDKREKLKEELRHLEKIDVISEDEIGLRDTPLKFETKSTPKVQSSVSSENDISGLSSRRKRGPERMARSLPTWFPERCLYDNIAVYKARKRKGYSNYSDCDYLHLILIGSPRAGKESLMHRYLYNSYRSDIGRYSEPESFHSSVVMIEEQKYCPIVHISTDSILNENFLLANDYILKMDSFMFVYDITNRESFELIQYYYDLVVRVRRIHKQKSSNPGILIGTSVDAVQDSHFNDHFILDLTISVLRSFFKMNIVQDILMYIPSSKNVTWYEGCLLAKRYNLPFLEVSSKYDDNCENAFYAALKEAIRFTKNTKHRKYSDLIVASKM